MIARNHKRTRNHTFEKPEIIDFSWDFSPEGLQSDNNAAYRQFLRNVYEYDHSKHDFDKRKFVLNI